MIELNISVKQFYFDLEEICLQQKYFLIWECIQSLKNTYVNVVLM
jgi:hypothetical protein